MEYLREPYALGDDTSTGERDKRRPPGSLCVQKPPVREGNCTQFPYRVSRHIKRCCRTSRGRSI
jgi:hypothetical protein